MHDTTWIGKLTKEELDAIPKYSELLIEDYYNPDCTHMHNVYWCKLTVSEQFKHTYLCSKAMDNLIPDGTILIKK
jgi:hypothetical protein